MTSASARDHGGTPGGLPMADFDRLAEFIHRVSGIKTPRSKHSMIENRLRKRVAATGAANLANYCAQVFAAGDDSPELVNLIDAVTTNKTDFFREPEHFRILTDMLLPAMDTARKPLKFWSSACSTGAEPYTLAMVMSEYRLAQQEKFQPMPPPVIVATDLCTKVLQTARDGIYPADMAEPVAPLLRKRYMLRARDRHAHTVRMAPSMRAMVRFGRLNLMAQSYDLDPEFDVIFCRNVLIYFDRHDQGAVLRRLCNHLRPGGALIIGHSETVNGLDLPVEPIGNTIFRRV